MSSFNGYPHSYDVFVPRVKAFCSFSAFQRAALVAVAFCIPSPRIRKHSDVYNELNIAHVCTSRFLSPVGVLMY